MREVDKVDFALSSISDAKYSVWPRIGTHQYWILNWVFRSEIVTPVDNVWYGVFAVRV